MNFYTISSTTICMENEEKYRLVSKCRIESQKQGILESQYNSLWKFFNDEEIEIDEHPDQNGSSRYTDIDHFITFSGTLVENGVVKKLAFNHIIEGNYYYRRKDPEEIRNYKIGLIPEEYEPNYEEYATEAQALYEAECRREDDIECKSEYEREIDFDCREYKVFQNLESLDLTGLCGKKYVAFLSNLPNLTSVKIVKNDSIKFGEVPKLEEIIVGNKTFKLS